MISRVRWRGKPRKWRYDAYDAYDASRLAEKRWVPMLLLQAAAFGGDLLVMVMGAHGHSHPSEWMFGGVPRTVLREAELPVPTSR
jgi:nucleotide-binding universal stress UspA family protein